MKWLAEGARGLSPAYIALVMATGIVSIASDRAAPCDCRCPPVAERGQYLLLWIPRGGCCAIAAHCLTT